MHRKLLALLFILSLMLSNSYGTLFANEMSTINNTLQIAGFPFSDDFEKVELGPDWSTNTLNGVVEINTAHPYSGTRSVFLGQKVDGSATASLILAIDLTEQTDVYLDFWARLQGRAIAKVSISADEGANWEDIHDLSQNSESFGHEILDIAKEADANNLQLNDQFRIRFLFVNGNGNSNKANDGLTIDDLRLTQQAQVIATFPFAQATFETKTFPQGLYPQSLLNGVVEINTAHPYSGTRSVFLGQRVDGSATASSILMIDLTGQTDVYLDFWARLQGRAIAKVFISGDGGTTWKMVRDLSQSSESFGHEILDIAKEADANNPLLTDQFRILFSFVNGNGNSNKANDGLTVDDLRIGSTNPDTGLKAYLPLVTR